MMASMHIRDILERDKTTISFEFFPPRSDKAATSLSNRLGAFESLEPSFVSVTYGAGGSTRQRTHDLVVSLKERDKLDPVPHLTCVMQKPGELDEILTHYAAHDISNILVIRGDAPEEAQGYDRLIKDFSYDQEKVAKFIGKSRSHIANFLRLLGLSKEVLKLIEEKKLTTGHAKILVGLENSYFVAQKIIEKKMSVRQAENFVKIFKIKKQSFKRSKDPNLVSLESSIQEKIGLNVLIKNKKNNAGSIIFEYKDLDQLNKIISIVKSNY